MYGLAWQRSPESWGNRSPGWVDSKLIDVITLQLEDKISSTAQWVEGDCAQQHGSPNHSNVALRVTRRLIDGDDPSHDRTAF
jgi:hypothetical protein